MHLLTLIATLMKSEVKYCAFAPFFFMHSKLKFVFLKKKKFQLNTLKLPIYCEIIAGS